MTPKEMIELNKVKLESKRQELIKVISSMNKDTGLLDFRQINIVVGNIQNDMAKLFNENELITQLSKSNMPEEIEEEPLNELI
jgi:hypothetical protein